MTDAADNTQQQLPTYDELLRAMRYIARYKTWNFQEVREPWRWCNEFVTVADQCLRGEKVLA